MVEKIKPENPYVYPDPMRGAESSITNQAPWNNSEGMTLRDHFAGMAMQAAVTALNMKEKYDTANEVLEVLDLIPKNAYWIADRMLEERQK